MGIDSNIRKKAARYLLELLDKDTSKEGIYYKMLLNFGLGKKSTDNLLDIIGGVVGGEEDKK